MLETDAMMEKNKKEGVPMSKQSVRQFRPAANPERAQAEAERARSHAWGTHEDRRTRRQRTRSAAKRQATKDWS